MEWYLLQYAMAYGAECWVLFNAIMEVLSRIL